MIEFVNKNLSKTEPEYFYRVNEFMTTFGKDPGNNNPISHAQDFKGNDLLKCKDEAEAYYFKRLDGLNNGTYFLDFAPQKEFVFGENAAFSINLYLVEYYNESEQYEHVLLGEDDETNNEGRQIEAMVLKEKGLL